jgi:hypothetical protein
VAVVKLSLIQQRCNLAYQDNMQKLGTTI